MPSYGKRYLGDCGDRGKPLLYGTHKSSQGKWRKHISRCGRIISSATVNNFMYVESAGKVLSKN
jgi:hypothetical protein